jgi:ribosomal protein L30E
MEDVTKSCEQLLKSYTVCLGFKLTVEIRYHGQISCRLSVCHRDIRDTVSYYSVAASSYANSDSFVTVHPFSKQLGDLY